MKRLLLILAPLVLHCGGDESLYRVPADPAPESPAVCVDCEQPERPVVVPAVTLDTEVLAPVDLDPLAPITVVDVEAPLPPELPPEETIWRGEYDCPGAQGVTSLELTTTRDLQTNTMTAIFAFGPHPQNPSLPTGAWAMEGQYDPATNGMRLLPSHWIQQPQGWQMVGMEGLYDGPQRQVHGDILSIFGTRSILCETFHLDRVP